LDFA
jgi:hypothetical protein